MTHPGFDKRLQASHDRFQALVTASPLLVWRADEFGNNVSFDGWANFTGQDEEKARGSGWAERLHTEDRPAVERAWADAICDSRPFFSEHRFRNKHDVYRWVRVRGIPVLDPNGTVREWVGTVKDIHDEREAQEELRSTVERFRLAARATNDAIWDHDLLTDHLEWGEASHTVLGYLPSDLGTTGEWWKERIHPGDKERVLEAIDATLRSHETSSNSSYRFRKGDGTYAQVLDRGYIIRDSSGRPVRMVGAIQDVTEAKKAERALRESEERYRFLAEHTSEMITRTDLVGVRTYVSPACLELTGFTAEELVGKEAFSVVHPEDTTRVRDVYGAIARGDIERDICTFRVKRKDGRIAWLEASYRVARDDSGAPREVVGVCRDITSRYELELQLRRAQKMEALGGLSGGLAHDFNNLLTIVLGNAEMLSEDLSDADHRMYARSIQEAAQRGADLTQRLLSFARRQSLQPERLPLDEVIRRMAELLHRTLGEDIELVTDLNCRDLGAFTDRALLESAILNLVVNARDAMPRGGKLTLSTGPGVADADDGDIPQGQPVVFLKVTDTGTGMSAEIIERAFEPFFTTKDVGRGSGLGLSMVYGFARQSAGHVSIQSETGKGTCVTLLLRQIPLLADPQTEHRESKTKKGAGLILVVEDEPEVRKFVCSQLRSVGYDVLEAADGAAGLALVKSTPLLDGLLTDIILPREFSGVELARLARQQNPDLAVILMSGYSEEAFEEHGRPAADMMLLRKPFRKQELADALEAALSRRYSPHVHDYGRTAA